MLLSRARDIIFGRPETSEEAAARRAAPPRQLRMLFWVIRLSSFFTIVVAFLWTNGWLPLVASKIDWYWFWAAFGLDLLQRGVWHWVSRRHLLRANAGMKKA